MKKYIKLITASVMALCMAFTCTMSYSVKAASGIQVGDKYWITYIGANLNARGRIRDISTVSKNKLGKQMVMTEKEDILINPFANANWDHMFNYGREVFIDTEGKADGYSSDKYFIDQYNNTYYKYRNEQKYNGETYELVGWKAVTTYNDNVDKYLEKFCYPTREEAEKASTFVVDYNKGNGIYIGQKQWNEALAETGQKFSDELNLAAVYTPKKAEFGTGTYEYDGTSRWDTQREQLADTSSKIETKVDLDTQEIIFKIPEGYDEETIQLTLDDELVKLFVFQFGIVGAGVVENGSSGTNSINKTPDGKPGVDPGHNEDIQPGDVRNFKIRIINESDNVYGYVDNSLNITTPNLSYYQNKGYTEPMPNNMRGFDGQQLMKDFTPTRTSNEAMRSLLANNTGKTVDELLNALYLNDPKGAENLNKYYLDYYNFVLGTSKTKLSDFSDDELRRMFRNEEASTLEMETNKEVAETLYNYFYNTALGVAPAKDLPVPGLENPGDSFLNQEYTVGNFMRNKNESFNTYMSEEIGEIAPNVTESSVDWGFQVDGRNCFNICNFMDYGFDMGFKLEKKVGDVTVTKNIDLNSAERNENPSFIFKLTDSKGVEYFKTLSFDEGELEKSVTFEDIPYGEYKVEEISSIRYEISNIENAEGVISDSNKEVKVEVTNRKEKDNDFSDSSLVVNSFKKTVSADGKTVIKPVKTEHNNKVRG